MWNYMSGVWCLAKQPKAPPSAHIYYGLVCPKVGNTSSTVHFITKCSTYIIHSVLHQTPTHHHLLLIVSIYINGFKLIFIIGHMSIMFVLRGAPYLIYIRNHKL